MSHQGNNKPVTLLYLACIGFVSLLRDAEEWIPCDLTWLLIFASVPARSQLHCRGVVLCLPGDGVARDLKEFPCVCRRQLGEQRQLL